MLKGKVTTIDEEFKKGDAPKLTKEESGQWLNLKILSRAKDCLRYPDKDKKLTLDIVTNKIYEGLVEDWVYNETVLNAMRALKVDRGYVMGVIEHLFDEDGNPIQPAQDSSQEAAKEEVAPYSDDGRAMPYYTASLVTIDEAHEEFQKARKPGAKDIKPRKKKRITTRYGITGKDEGLPKKKVTTSYGIGKKYKEK